MICVYIEYLKNKGNFPNTIRNKISQVKTFLLLSQQDVKNFENIRVTRAMDAMLKRKDIDSKAKDMIPLDIFKKIVNSVPIDGLGWNFRAILLVIFFGALRQTEVVPPSVNKFSAARFLTRGDFEFTGENVVITLRWAKNIRSVYKDNKVILTKAQDKRFCPVTAVVKAFKAAPSKNPSDAAFMFPATKTPIPASHVRGQWALYLRKLHIDSKIYSLHSIRKLSASIAFNQGCSVSEIQMFGNWASEACKVYIKHNTKKKVNTILKNAIC